MERKSMDITKIEIKREDSLTSEQQGGLVVDYRHIYKWKHKMLTHIDLMVLMNWKKLLANF